MSNKSFWGLVAVIAAVCGGIWTLWDFADKQQRAFVVACEARGGKALLGRDLNACIDPRALR